MRKMLGGGLAVSCQELLIAEKGFDGVCQRLQFTVRKQDSTGANGIGQPAACGADRHTTTGNAFQRHQSKRLLPAGGNHDDLMRIQQRRQILGGVGAQEADLGFESEAGALFLKRDPLGAVADDREPGGDSFFLKNPSEFCRHA